MSVFQKIPSSRILVATIFISFVAACAQDLDQRDYGAFEQATGFNVCAAYPTDMRDDAKGVGGNFPADQSIYLWLNRKLTNYSIENDYGNLNPNKQINPELEQAMRNSIVFATADGALLGNNFFYSHLVVEAGTKRPSSCPQNEPISVIKIDPFMGSLPGIFPLRTVVRMAVKQPPVLEKRTDQSFGLYSDPVDGAVDDVGVQHLVPITSYALDFKTSESAEGSDIGGASVVGLSVGFLASSSMSGSIGDYILKGITLNQQPTISIYWNGSVKHNSIDGIGVSGSEISKRLIYDPTTGNIPGIGMFVLRSTTAISSFIKSVPRLLNRDGSQNADAQTWDQYSSGITKLTGAYLSSRNGRSVWDIQFDGNCKSANCLFPDNASGRNVASVVAIVIQGVSNRTSRVNQSPDPIVIFAAFVRELSLDTGFGSAINGWFKGLGLSRL